MYTLEPRGTNAYVGGSFSTVGGQPRNRAAEISLLTGGATTWNPDVNATVYSIKRHGNTVYLAGDFTSVSGQSRTYVAAVNAANGSPASWSPVLNAGVRKLALTDSLLFIGGSFTSISGTTRNRLASFVMANGLMTDWNPDVNGTVNDLQLLGSSLYIGGYFTEVAGQSRGSAASFALENGALKSWNPKITGSVAALTGKGNYLYLGGGFNEAGGQTSHGFAAIHTRTGIPELFFPNVQGSLYTVSAFDSLVYFGGSFSTVDGINFGGLASASYPFGSFKPRLDDYTPKSGGNTGSVTLVINGNTFGKGAEVTLRRNGQPDIPLREMYLADGSQISGTLDLRGAAPGKWDLIIKLEADSVFSLMDGFTIEPGTAPQPWSTVMGFDQIRTNRWQSYNLVYGNSGNTDAKGVPVWFTVSNNAQLDLKYPVSRTSQYFNIAQDDLYDSLTSFIVIDTVLDIIGPAKLVGVYLPTIPANSSNALTFKVKLTAPGTIRMISWADEPYFADSVRSWVPECYETLYDKGLSVNPANNCLNESLNQGYSVGSKSLQQVLNGNIGAGAGSLVFSMPAIMASGLKECVPGLGNPQIQSSTTEITKLLSESYVNRLKGGRNADSISSCLPPTSAPAQLPGIQTVSSFDPNDKVGPVGVGNEHFFKVNQVFPYIIRCENISTATAPAQTVIILDTLDQALLDLASFQLGFLSIADSIIPVPRGLQHYETDIDLRPANNIIAHVKADLDLLTGIARWEFTSLDPATLEETEDPLAGFLPPNLSNAEGEASVMFTINAKGPVANGTQFKNRASIYFDSNAPILTPRWINTNDVQSPVSQVKPLPAVQFKDSIELHLQGEDLLSGLRSYALYYAVNGGIFSLLEPYLTDTTYLFKGEFGSDYAFFSIATDSLGNVEAMKNTAEASTSFAVGVETPAALSVTVYPNPNNGQFELAVRPQSSGTYTLTLTDLMGRSLQEEELWLNSGENLIPLTMEQSGIYFLTLGNQHTKTVKRVVVNK